MRIARDQRRRRHDLPRLAVTALRDLQIEPGFLDRLPSRGPTHGLDGCDRSRADAVDRGDAGAHRLTVNVDGAGAAQRHPATELGAGHAEQVAQHPKQSRVAVNIDAVGRSVDFDGEGHGYLRSAFSRSGPHCSVTQRICPFDVLAAMTYIP